MFIPHIDILPFVYGIIIFFGLWSMWLKLTSGRLGSFIIELAVFIIVFKLHGGSMTGGLAATIAALIAGRVFTWRRARSS